MDIERCYEILEITPEASLEEVRQAYRDSVSVWHPDRFGERNPRLTRRAEEKVKQINEAYETLISVCGGERGAHGKSGDITGAGKNASGASRAGRFSGKERGQAFCSRTEAVAEAGTRLVLTASSQLIKVFRRWVESGGV